MDETPEIVTKKRGWPKGKKRAPKIVVPPLPEETPAPIFVRLRLKNYAEPVEFGCATRSVENGFHVFTYPSERDRYRMTRREFAISEIIEIEITEACRVYDYTAVQREEAVILPPTAGPSRPVIHSARQSALSALETSKGPIKMENLPNLTFGDSAG